jgi:hypothetical protein
MVLFKQMKSNKTHRNSACVQYFKAYRILFAAKDFGVSEQHIFHHCIMCCL